MTSCNMNHYHRPNLTQIEIDPETAGLTGIDWYPFAGGRPPK